MEESPYAPNSIPPALVVFGGSSYGDPIRMQRPFSSQVYRVSDGKQLNLSNLSASGFGLRPMESYGGLPAQLVHLQNPFLHPALEARLPFGTAGAFRPVVTSSATTSNVGGGTSVGGGDERRDVKNLPSAFTPPSSNRSLSLGRSKFGEGDGGGASPGGVSSFSSQQQSSSAAQQSVGGVMNLEKSYINGGRHRSLSPPNNGNLSIKEERQQQQLNEVGQDFVMDRDESGTPNSDLTDRSSPEEPHLPTKRRRGGGGGLGGGGGSVGAGEVGCPVCKMSVRPLELESHLLSEVEQLMCMSRLGQRSTSVRTQDDPSTSNQDSPSASAANQHKKESTAEVSQDSRWETYHRVRSNRHSRLRLKTRRRREESGGPHVNCPVCQMPLQGSNEQLSAHVETCLRKNGDMLDEDEPVDIEGDGDGDGPEVEDYEWIAQRRARPLANISPNYPHSGAVTALNMTTGSRRRDRERDADENDSLEVVVDGDDSSTYGHAQYTESDIQSTLSQTSSDPHLFAPYHAHGLSHPRPTPTNTPNTQDSKTDAWEDEETLEGGDECGSAATPGGGSNLNQTMLLKALKGRIRELEKQVKAGLAHDGHQCLICMEKYKKPVVSISCWHVHCEECWLRTLGAKKLCPQCNMITSASDLRRIFL